MSHHGDGMAEVLKCWKCGSALHGVPMPLSRLSECLVCHAELYVCRMCRFYDSKLRQGCREDRAEHVQEKMRANFCEYFQPQPDAYQATDQSPARVARAQLDALFGGDDTKPAADSDRAHSELENLFKSKKPAD